MPDFAADDFTIATAGTADPVTINSTTHPSNGDGLHGLAGDERRPDDGRTELAAASRYEPAKDWQPNK
jgi:hypothetical protein